MTVPEAAKMLEVSPDLVYRLCRAGRLAHSRIGLRRGVIRIERRDVEAFLASRRVEASDEPTERVVVSRRGSVVVPDIIGERRARMRERAQARTAAKPSR